MDTICGPNIMILAQGGLQICVYKVINGLNAKSEKENNSVKYSQNFMKS